MMTWLFREHPKQRNVHTCGVRDRRDGHVSNCLKVPNSPAQ